MSQDYVLLVGATDTFAVSDGKINNMSEALRSAFSGSSFPSSPTPVEGQLCYRTDQDKLYVYVDAAWKEIAIESTGIGLEVINARGTKPTLDQRMDVALNEDGTLKASTTLNPSQWYKPSLTFTYISATSFKVNGDQTDIYKSSRRLKCNLTGSTVYSEVTSSSYASGPDETTVNIYDSVLDATLVDVEHSLFLPRKDNGALSNAMINNLRLVSKSSTYNVTDNDNIVLLDSSGGAFTVNLPSASSAGSGRIYHFKKITNDTNIVTITTGGNRIEINRYGETISVVSDGTNWLKIENNDESLFSVDVFGNFVVSGLLGSDPGATLTMTIPSGVAYVSGKRIRKSTSDSDMTYTYTASKDTYDYLKNDGTIVHQAVANGAGEPSQPANTVKLQKVVTNATEITGVTSMRTIHPTSIAQRCNRSVYTSSNSWVVPYGVTDIEALMIGGGGGGGGGKTGGGGGGGGGGSGGIIHHPYFAVTQSSTLTITIGAGGVGGVGGASPVNGSNGGNTSVTGLPTANGGNGGQAGQSSDVGGTGGVAGNTFGTTNGSDGGAANGGDGGSNVKGGVGGAGGVATSGANGTVYGGGGGGGSDSGGGNNGGNGANGLVIIIW